MRGGAFVDNLTKEQIKEVILENFAGKSNSTKVVKFSEIQEQLSYYEYEQSIYDAALADLQKEGLVVDFAQKTMFLKK